MKDLICTKEPTVSHTIWQGWALGGPNQFYMKQLQNNSEKSLNYLETSDLFSNYIFVIFPEGFSNLLGNS